MNYMDADCTNVLSQAISSISCRCNAPTNGHCNTRRDKLSLFISSESVKGLIIANHGDPCSLMLLINEIIEPGSGVILCDLPSPLLHLNDSRLYTIACYNSTPTISFIQEFYLQHITMFSKTTFIYWNLQCAVIVWANYNVSLQIVTTGLTGTRDQLVTPF